MVERGRNDDARSDDASTSATVHAAAAQGYATAGKAYERGRPDYPAEAVAHVCRALALGPESVVVDLAAGTGKFTRLLRAATPARVVAVEPVAGMRQALAQTGLAGLTVLEGTAEAVPLESSSVDAVTVAQAFHWFDGERALSEIHRVLRPAGRLALLWNVRDEATPWVAELTAIVDRHEAGAPRHRTGQWRRAFETTRLFGPLELASFRHLHHGDRGTVIDRALSISFIAALPESERHGVASEVDRLIDRHFGAGFGGTIDFPYRTDVYVTARS